jgi:hypothetical protein
MSNGPRTLVYVDGFNLYYGAVKGTELKWLNIVALSRRLLPSHDVLGVKYFTAIVSGKDDPQSPIRQQTFIRALRAIGEIEIFLGLFSSHDVWRPLTVPSVNNPWKEHQFYATSRICAQVVDTKEKGSDVNLAAHLLNDAWLDRYDAAVIISNDSDLATAIELVKQHKKKTIGIVNPRRNKPLTAELNRLADFRHTIRANDLTSCQLPSPIPGTNITKPIEWQTPAKT